MLWLGLYVLERCMLTLMVRVGGNECYVQIGRILLSVQLTSMLPCGHPEPPETTLVILKDVGARGLASGTGLARDIAARARVASAYFIAELGYGKMDN
jgi:hypothetical protein